MINNVSFRKLKRLPKDFPGSPTIVGGGFYCIYNNLTSLTNSPRVVLGRFNCGYNNLTCLKSGPRIVGWFSCWNNRLISLDFLPVKYNDLKYF